jgi:GTP-binding protein EngB required for normal cell division
MEQIDLFNIKKGQLQDCIKHSLTIFKDLGMTNEVNASAEINEKLDKDTFKVFIMGQFRVGKSTFINSLLGADILPAYVIPTTAIINEVKYSKERSAIIHFKNPVPTPYPANLKDSIKAHINKYNGKDVVAIKIPVNNIENYVVINDDLADQKDAVAQTPYKKAELFWNLPLCEQGVEIIDSPGLNEHISRTMVTMDYLTKVDAIIFVMRCPSLCAANEMEVINKDILKAGHEYVFFVCNGINQIKENERERLKQHTYNRLKDKTRFGEKGIFFINAEAAKDGRIHNDEKQIQESGILAVEALLENFLAHNRGSVKLKQPATKIKLYIDKAIQEVIPNEVKMLALSAKEIDSRLQREMPNLQRLRREKDQLKERLNNRIDRIKGELSVEITKRFDEIIKEVPNWINEIQTDNSFSAWHPKDSAATFSKEVVDKLAEKYKEEQEQWQKNVLTPFIDIRLRELETDFETRLTRFLTDIEQIKLRISGNDNVETPGMGQRIGAAVVGLIGGGIGGAAAGGAFGFSKEFVGIIVAQIVTIITCMLLGLSNPVTIAAVIVIAIFGRMINEGGIEGKIKNKIASEILKTLRDEKDTNVQKIVNDIYSKMCGVTKNIDQNLSIELNSVEEQVNKIKGEKATGEQQVANRVRQLESYKQALNSQKNRISSIISNL